MSTDRVESPNFFWPTRPVPHQEKLRIEVNHIADPYHMIFNILDDSYNKQFTEMMETLKFRYVQEIRFGGTNMKIPKSCLRVSLPCVVNYENVCFRGVIINKTDSFVKVRTVDYGVDVVITRSEYDNKPLYWMDRSLANIPIQGIAGKLKFLRPKGPRWTKEATDMLADLLQNQEVYAIIVKPGPSGEKLELCLESIETGENIEVALVRAGLAEFVTDPDVDEETPDASSADLEPPQEDKPFLDRAICAIDRPSSASSLSSCSDDDLEISRVRVYSSGASDLSDADADVATHPQDSPSPPAVSVGLPSLERPVRRSASAAVAAGVAPSTLRLESEALTSVSRSGRLSSVNVTEITDPMEKAKLRDEICEEMRCLQARLAQLERINDSDEGAATTVLNPDAKEFKLPRPAAPSSVLRPDAQEFWPNLGLGDRNPDKHTVLFNDESSVETDPSPSTMSLRADAEVFTPQTLPQLPQADVSQDSDAGKKTLRPDVPVFQPRRSILDVVEQMNATPLSPNAPAFSPQRFSFVNAGEVNGKSLSADAPAFRPQCVLFSNGEGVNGKSLSADASVFSPHGVAFDKTEPENEKSPNAEDDSKIHNSMTQHNSSDPNLASAVEVEKIDEEVQKSRTTNAENIAKVVKEDERTKPVSPDADMIVKQNHEEKTTKSSTPDSEVVRPASSSSQVTDTGRIDSSSPESIVLPSPSLSHDQVALTIEEIDPPHSKASMPNSMASTQFHTSPKSRTLSVPVQPLLQAPPGVGQLPRQPNPFSYPPPPPVTKHAGVSVPPGFTPPPAADHMVHQHVQPFGDYAPQMAAINMPRPPPGFESRVALPTYFLQSHPTAYPDGSALLNHAVRSSQATGAPIFITRKETWVVSDVPPPTPTVRSTAPNSFQQVLPPHGQGMPTVYPNQAPPQPNPNNVFYYPLGSR